MSALLDGEPRRTTPRGSTRLQRAANLKQARCLNARPGPTPGIRHRSRGKAHGSHCATVLADSPSNLFLETVEQTGAVRHKSLGKGVSFCLAKSAAQVIELGCLQRFPALHKSETLAQHLASVAVSSGAHELADEGFLVLGEHNIAGGRGYSPI